MDNNIIYNNKIMLTVLLVLFLSVCVIGGIRHVLADDNIPYDKSFVSIEISDGDTLSSIAEQYAISPSYYNSYVEEVKSINNLKGDTIHAGCYLMVPVYTPVQS